MEIPIQVAVRVYPCATPDDSPSCLQVIPMIQTPTHGLALASIATGVVQVGVHSFPVTHVLPFECPQGQIYHQTVYPLIGLFLEGFDASVVTYGQKGTGKSFTLYGPGFDCIFGESEQGVVQRCVREIYAQLSNQQERSYAINIAWVEIVGDVVRDLLEAGSVPCNTVSDVFHWMQIGMANKASEVDSHNLFTITLEQQWVSKEGLIQHRLSTASFSDLCGTKREFELDQQTSTPKDLGLQALERVASSLTDPALMHNNSMVDYNQTTLTTLLKDSFGGRAQTLVIMCVSPLERDMNETVFNMQFAFKVQCVRNYVIMNTFSDNNTPISPDVVDISSDPAETFGLQFAASQWFKLVSNAEGLFAKLVSTKAVSDVDREQIEEWLFLKQECEDCLSSSEALRSQKQLGPIQETEEPDEATSDPETSCQQNSDNESDSESQRPDLEEKLESILDELRHKTDNLVKDKYNEFIKNQPKAVMESSESFRPSEDRRASSSVGGRRRSIQPGAALSSVEIAMLNRVASREQMTTKSTEEFFEGPIDMNQQIRIHNSPVDTIQNKLRKINTDIEAKQCQIKELEHTISLKQNIITDLIKNNDTRTTAKQRFNKKKGKLESEYEKTKKQLSKAVVNGKDKTEIERLKALTSHIEHRLQDLVSIKHIAGESGQKVKKLQQSVHESKKQMDDLQKKLKKEKKLKEHLESEIKITKEKENTRSVLIGDEKGKNLKQVQARISHLDHVLKEKSENLEQFGDGEEKNSLRHEIRNLRRTRDHLLDQRCALDRKLKKDNKLSHREERKLLECDEAIEAIDAAIEFKNELICGRKSIDTSERLQREEGEKMLMARLNKLSPEEMRTLLYKYFTKVIDLRDSSRKLEMQLMSLEREKDAWEWKERVLSNAVRQARLEGERNAVLLQRQHETKLTLMLRHLTEETSASSSFSDRLIPHPSAVALTSRPSPTSQPSFSESDFDLDLYKNHATKHLLKPKHNDIDICPLPDALTKYKPLDKIKEKERDSKNKLFAKFQVLTRYHGQAGGSSSSDKKKAVDPAIPQENLRQLLSTPSATKVTRQKNKIIIQDSSRKNI